MQEIVYHSNFQIESNYFWFLSRNAIVYNAFKKICNLNIENNKNSNNLKQTNVLDIGCGTGGFASMLDQNGYNVHCLDTEPIALEYCKKRGLTNLYNCYINELKSKIDKNLVFDTAFALDVIEHIEDDKAAIKDIYDLLPQNGYFVTTVPAYQWLWSEHDKIHMHYRRYTKNEYVELLKSQGFHIKYDSYFNTLLFPAVVAKRFLDKLTNKKSTDPVDKVSESMNKLLRNIFDKELSLIPNIKLPFGLSIIVIAQKL
ncbi:MAG: class I SAM-dependent methyltransferase [Candidatus Kapaibacteriota bacterium]|jgi:2-polyprenyl-3-methyl-5-hydroxy-6-metoxy-1,4-benzoquinol methylase